uniref:Uncharacterized protein n=1 Tax=Romanomermis culicivorax TaxID=13658 RepID=A0A915IV41_ROMCU
MSSFDFLECVLAPESSDPTERRIPSDGYLISGESFRNFNSKMTLNGLPPLIIPGKKGGYVDVLIDNIEC